MWSNIAFTKIIRPCSVIFSISQWDFAPLLHFNSLIKFLFNSLQYVARRQFQKTVEYKLSHRTLGWVKRLTSVTRDLKFLVPPQSNVIPLKDGRRRCHFVVSAQWNHSIYLMERFHNYYSRIIDLLIWMLTRCIWRIQWNRWAHVFKTLRIHVFQHWNTCSKR